MIQKILPHFRVEEATFNALAVRIQHWVIQIATWTVFIISLVALAGIVLQSDPILYTWGTDERAISIQLVYALTLLSIGLLIYRTFPAQRYRFSKPLALVCCVLALGIGIMETVYFLRAGGEVSLESFLVPESPILGHLSLYSDIGLLFIAACALIQVLFASLRGWTLWLSQLLAIGSINLGMFAISQNLAMPTDAYLVAFPASISFFLFGVALLFSSPVESRLLRPFFSPFKRIRFYTLLVCLAWASIVLWQTFFGWDSPFFVSSPDGVVVSVHNILTTLRMIEILLMTFVSGLGLNVMGALDENAQLAKQLQEAFERYAMLAATLSHDLKAPIQTEISAIDMIQEGQFGAIPQKASNMLSAVNENNRFELELVLNLINLLQYELTEAPFHPVTIELNTFLEEIRQELNPLALRKGQLLQIHPWQGFEQTLVADVTGLKRVLHNLVNNAIQHLSTGHHIDVEISQTNPETFLFTIRDDGPGIPPDIQQALFTRFSKSKVKAGTASGSGLGLYVSKQIIQRHGGQIGVDSTPDQGTVFYFTLPKLTKTASKTNTRASNPQQKPVAFEASNP